MDFHKHSSSFSLSLSFFFKVFTARIYIPEQVQAGVSRMVTRIVVPASHVARAFPDAADVFVVVVVFAVLLIVTAPAAASRIVSVPLPVPLAAGRASRGLELAEHRGAWEDESDINHLNVHVLLFSRARASDTTNQ